jgi:hypothetical protein
VNTVKKLRIKGMDKWLMVAAFIAVALSAVGYLWQDVWLASTQWLLVAAVLALFSIYFKE